MATTSLHSFRCPTCGTAFDVQRCDIVNVAEDPELKASVINGEIFLQECPRCDRRHLVNWPLVYLDPDEHLMLVLSERGLSLEDTQGYTARLVSRAGDLIEKVKIFDAGLDDRAVELCKYVTKQEMGREVELRFLRLDGADGDLVFTYPEKGEMMMLGVGFNVYEDSRGILGRNPQAAAQAKGLAVVDEAWVNSLFR